MPEKNRCAICFEEPPEAPAVLPVQCVYLPGGGLEIVLPPGSVVCGNHFVAPRPRPGVTLNEIRAGLVRARRKGASLAGR